MGLLDKNVWRQNSPGNRGYFVTVANIFGHILKIKIICQNVPYRHKHETFSEKVIIFS